MDVTMEQVQREEARLACLIAWIDGLYPGITCMLLQRTPLPLIHQAQLLVQYLVLGRLVT